MHKEKGFFVTEGGYEYNLALAAAAFALADLGPGPLSLDRALGTERSRPAVALAALGAGLAGPRLLRAPRAGGAAEPRAAKPTPLRRRPGAASTAAPSSCGAGAARARRSSAPR